MLGPARQKSHLGGVQKLQLSDVLDCWPCCTCTATCGYSAMTSIFTHTISVLWVCSHRVSQSSASQFGRKRELQQVVWCSHLQGFVLHRLDHQNNENFDLKIGWDLNSQLHVQHSADSIHNHKAKKEKINRGFLIQNSGFQGKL